MREFTFLTNLTKYTFFITACTLAYDSLSYNHYDICIILVVSKECVCVYENSITIIVDILFFILKFVRDKSKIRYLWMKISFYPVLFSSNTVIIKIIYKESHINIKCNINLKKNSKFF